MTLVEIFPNNETNNVDSDIIEIYVKEVYTCNVKTYYMNNNITICRMIEILRDNVLNDFMIEKNISEFVDIVQTLQPGINAEDGLSLTESLITIKNKYNAKFIALYVRRIIYN